MEDVLVPGGQEVARGRPGPCGLVDGDRGQAGIGVAFHHDHRHVGGQVLQCFRGRGEGSDHDDAFHHLVVQAAHGVSHRVAIDGAQAHDADEVAGDACRLLDAVQGGHRAEKGAVEGDDPEGPGVSGRQGPGGCVETVPEPVGGGEHAGPGHRAHAGMLAQRPRDGLGGDTGELGHVGHGRRPARRSGAPGGHLGKRSSVSPGGGAIARSRGLDARITRPRHLVASLHVVGHTGPGLGRARATHAGIANITPEQPDSWSLGCCHFASLIESTRPAEAWRLSCLRSCSQAAWLRPRVSCRFLKMRYTCS